MSKKNVGRPISKPNRVKIGLSISGKSNSILCELVKKSEKTKSRVFEEAIESFENINSNDKLSELEKVILNHYLTHGYEIGIGDWSFNVDIMTSYKCKVLRVIFWETPLIYTLVYASKSHRTTLDMFDNAIKFFKDKT